jgi:hypothetical protein
LDDFAIYGNRESHLQHVKAAFERLAIHKSSLSPEKCKLGFCEGTLLGHVVCREGIKVDPEKVKRILELKTPRNHKEVSTLWGMANYHNTFIPNLAAVARPITSLLRRSTIFEWTEECDLAWSYIRENLAKDPVIRKLDWQKAFMINPSASKVVVATVLIQNDETGWAHPIYYASRLLTSCELKYSPSEKSTVALLFSCTKFKHYLLSSPHPITV